MSLPKVFVISKAPQLHFLALVAFTFTLYPL